MTKEALNALVDAGAEIVGVGVKFALKGTVTPRIKQGHQAVGQLEEGQESSLFIFACVRGAILVQRGL